MRRRLHYFMSAFILAAVMAWALGGIDTATHSRRVLDTAVVRLAEAKALIAAESQRLLPTRPEAIAVAPKPAPAQAVAAARENRFKPSPIPEVRVRAARDGRDYGWVQLPRGTQVELLRDEGETLVVRYDQVVLRIPRVQAEAGMVVPVARSGRVAGL